ncbi:hypothetical protein R3P38DRAFT_3444133 [Favolaschia claudopus]|uniref:K Homology domain-containing protein n=1 Tax=Favolaschia claudopus TaxID=2862362 RepID=A0AAV9ZPC7_9AGAR
MCEIHERGLTLSLKKIEKFKPLYNLGAAFSCGLAAGAWVALVWASLFWVHPHASHRPTPWAPAVQVCHRPLQGFRVAAAEWGNGFILAHPIAHKQSVVKSESPTPAIIAVGHTAIPLAETLPTAQDAPSRYSCTLVVPDSVVGHIIGRGGKGLHQSHDISGAQLRAYTDKASPLERRVSIRGTDQQIGEALIALGKRFMRKRIRSKKKGPSRLSGDPAPPPPGPVPVLPNASGEGARPLKKRAHPVHPSQPPARFRPLQRPVLSRTQVMVSPIPTQVMVSPIPTPRPSSTPYAPSVAMPTAIPSPSPRSVAPSPMAIDAIRPERGRRQQTARRGGAVSASDSRIDSQGNLLFRGDPGF